MLELAAWLTPILAADVINPVLLAAVIFCLGSRRPYLSASMVLAGWFIVYLAAGIAIALSLDALTALLENPRPIDYAIELALGILLIGLGVRTIRTGERSKEPEYKSNDLTPGGAFGIGALINAVGLPFAVPYFGAIDQILKTDLSALHSVLVLAAYNVGYVAPFAAIIVVRVMFGKRADPWIEKVNVWIDRIGDVLLPLILFVIAALMIIDASLFFARGEGF